MEGVFYQKLLFVVAIAPGVMTGLELSINANTAGYELATEAGLTQSLWCAVKHPSQDEELRWLRGDQEVILQEGNKVNASNVCISPVTDEDNGVSFTCQLARDNSVQISVLLNVAYAPILTGEDPPGIPAEWDATLDCRVKANPPAQLTWLKDNQSLSLEDSRYWIFQTSELFQLTIKQLQSSDGGIYTCVARSPRGTSRKDFHLVVEGTVFSMSSSSCLPHNNNPVREKTAFPHRSGHRCWSGPVPHSSLRSCGSMEEDHTVFQENRFFQPHCPVKEFLFWSNLFVDPPCDFKWPIFPL
ncbi:transmembrane and immunoglobulin domain-containing protein 1 [Ahaetulla prasina]|uniref:transmembrane and immunoglobulin domain-containing protein 1 n=1 Tax=Ahaetulla prasina TaxID=499056 RepID=UPI002647BA43|nr:transmembrane and immunoglobulin domain-containing protein 1 [Ahaetulla prasina]XP_058019962.1 transmembrane and immunoglobulin domain-containing protein 1 [Ahaetulla prasina]